MFKINLTDELKIYNNNIYKFDKSYSIYTDKRTMNRKANNIILPKHSDVHPEVKWLNELEKRYCNLYRNAPLIIGYISDYMPDSFKEEVFKRTGFKPSYEYLYSPDIVLNKYRGLTALEILEDYMLGYDTKNSSDLEKIIALNKKHPDKNMERVFEEFDFSKGNIGFSKFDEAMKILLDVVYSFVQAQKEKGIINGAVKTEHGYSIYDNISGIPHYVLNAKLDVLERYYSILEFKNHRSEKHYELSRGMETLKFTNGFNSEKAPIRFSLVGQNKFLDALAITRYSFGEVIRLSSDFKSDIYFKLHDEIPWFHNAICNKIHDVEDSCDTEFFPREEDIFYVDNKFVSICPCCGGRVTTGVMSRHHKTEIEGRIRKRSMEDPNLDRKLTLLSELIKLGGVSYNEEKIKEKYGVRKIKK
ncbi:MAG: hypothetical protein IJN90_06805 [Bacilli bacterium]|nr:hypothetical protein [Bacilli bacterium]